jgi:PhnB protein
MPVKPVPDGFRTVTPYLVVEDVPRLIDFLKAAFGAVETERVDGPGGRVAHAEVRIGDSIVMMGGAMERFPAIQTMLYVYVPDADAVYGQALQAGATSVMEPANQFYGDRSGGVKDPAGNTWWIATHVEDVPRDELQRRALARA